MYDFTPGQIRVLREATMRIPDSVICMPLKEEFIASIPELWQTYVNPAVNNRPILKTDEAQVVIKVMMFEFAMLTTCNNYNQGIDSLVFPALFCSIANTLGAIEQLAITGFDFQAYTLMRTLVEQYIVLITLTLCPEKREEYCKTEDKEVARKFWHDNFTQKRFVKLINDYKKDSDGILENYINTVYRELSAFTHNNFWHSFSKAYIPTEDGSGVKANLFGEHVCRAEQILQQLICDAWPLHLLFFQLLDDSNIDISYESLMVTSVPLGLMNLLKRCQIVERSLVDKLLSTHRSSEHE